MKTARKAIMLVLCVVLLVVASVMGTLAYLTDTEDVVNTFTVGKVAITLDETNLAPNATGRTDVGNDYHLLPGKTYVKDPIVHVDAESDDSYIFIKVDNNGVEAIEETAADYTSVSAQILANGWTWWKNEGNVHYFYQEYTKNQDDKNLEVFQQFKVGDAVTNEQLEAFYTAANTNNGQTKAVIVTAYAIQKTGFEDNVSGAWTALQNQLSATNP